MKMSSLWIFYTFSLTFGSAVGLLYPVINSTDSAELEELRRNLSAIELVAQRAENDVIQLKQELNKETALRSALQQELENFKRQNFTAVLQQLTTATDVLNEVHLLRQLLNQETTFRISMRNEIQQNELLTNALRNNLTALISQLQAQRREFATNQSLLEREVKMMELKLQNEVSSTDQKIAAIQQNVSLETLRLQHSQLTTDTKLATINHTVYDSVSQQFLVNQRHENDIQMLAANQSSMDTLLTNFQQYSSMEMLRMWSNITNIQHVIDQSTVIAFSARLSHPISNFQPKQVIKFDYTLYNQGDHYSPKTGVFTAPSPGVYVLFWSTLTVNGHYISSVLQVNGTPTLGALSDGRGTSGFDSASNMAVLRLTNGDRVWVEHESGSYIHSDFSTFSGFRISTLVT